jgi:hypothetical protein
METGFPTFACLYRIPIAAIRNLKQEFQVPYETLQLAHSWRNKASTSEMQNTAVKMHVDYSINFVCQVLCVLFSEWQH